MNFRGLDRRERRSILNGNMFFRTFHYGISNYSTDTHIEKKTEIDDTLLSKIRSIPDPLKKNLADTVIVSAEEKVKAAKMSVVDENYQYPSYSDAENLEITCNSNHNRGDYMASITGFMTSLFDAISGAVFTKRPKSPDVQYFDCCDADKSHEMPPPSSWPSSKINELNKTLATDSCEVNDNMNDSGAAVAQCETKLNEVRRLLSSESVPKSSKSSQPSRLRLRRPKKVFVQPGSVHDSYVEEFDTGEFVSLANEDYIEYFGVSNNIIGENCEVQASNMKTEFAPEKETSADIIKSLPLSDKEINISVSENSNSHENSISLQDSETTDIVKILPQILETDVKSEVSNTADKIISTEIVNTITTTPERENSNTVTEQVTKKEIITSCEDKMARLKSLLQNRRQNKCHRTANDSSSHHIAAEPKTTNLGTESLPNISITECTKEVVTKKPPKPIPIQKPKDKKFKNSHRLTDKRKHSRLRKVIQEDMLFANEIDSGDISDNTPKVHNSKIRKDSFHNCLDTLSAEASPMSRSLNHLTETPASSVENDYFDEMKGRFYTSSTTDSEDSFQIVFSESPKVSRLRRPSDCDSEDSFIVFEDSPDSCYTSNDVFGDSDCESDVSETDSELSDSGCNDVSKLSPNMSRTIGDLTDDSLYENEQDKEVTKDEIDCAVRTFEEIPSEEVGEGKRPGLLIDEQKKLRRKNQPPKKVRFSEKPPKVRVMRVWAFAARQARPGPWERYVLDRERFKRRIADVDMAVSWVLKPQHRSRVMFQRFMPWWNAQKRKELAEKKEAEKRKKEEEIRQEKILKEEQEKEAMLLEEQMHKESEETKHLDENDGLGGKVEEKRREELLNEQKDSGKLQDNETDTIDYHVGKDLQDKNIPEEHFDKMSIEKKNIDADTKLNSKNQTEVTEIPSDSRSDTAPVHQDVNNQVCVKQDLNQIAIQGTTLNQDDQNVKRGKQCNVKNQVEINKEKIQQKNIKQNSSTTKPESNKKNCLNKTCIKIENYKDVVKLNNFETNDIIKTDTENQSKNKIITVND